MIAHRSFVVWVGFVSLLAFTSVGQAQEILGGTAADNVSGGALAARAPGRMVNAGIGRSVGFAEFARSVPNITDLDSGELSPRQMFLVDAIDIVFDQLNLAILGFHNLFLARAGEPPYIPADMLSDLLDQVG